MPLIFQLTELDVNLNINKFTPYFTILIAVLLVSKLPTFSFKKISVSPKSTVFILLAIGTIFIALLYYTFEALLILGILYLISIPISFVVYNKQSKKIISKTSDDEHEDVL